MALQQLSSVEAAVDWLVLRGAAALAADSRQVQPGDAFIAWPGYAKDARAHVRDALKGGARACLVEAEGAEPFGFDADDRIAALLGLKAAAGPMASRFMAAPSEQLRVIACTGTNGKTTSTWWIAQALTRLGRPCGVIGTLGIGAPMAGNEPLTDSGLTTPDPITLQKSLRHFVDRGFAATAIEASSIGIAEERLAGTRIDTALFTNFSQDHLDYHRDMARYWAEKARLFDWPGLRAAVVNVDDPAGRALAAQLAAVAIELWTYGQDVDARLRATDIRVGVEGLRFTVCEGASQAVVDTALIGHYNVANLLGVIGVLRAGGFSLPDAAAACCASSPVPGRLQRIHNEAARLAPLVVVDYAHTPDALEHTLCTLQPLAMERGGQLWCVFGCGGNRDAAKRPLMGALACRFADRVVITSDNPRLEAPDFIIAQILAGAVGHDEVDVIENRAEALRHAIIDANESDVVLVAGKGHEAFQDIGGVKHVFSDAEHARQALQARLQGGSLAGSAETAP